MASVKHYIQAARLRTLPLSISGIILGSVLASEDFYKNVIFWLAIVTTICFQVLSNYANDYGDGIKGTDDNRVGEKRLVAAGIITANQMKKAVIISVICSAVASLSLIYASFGSNQFLQTLLFLGLGVLCIVAAIKYTVGNSAYGYLGLGDVFVFIFFGLFSTIGSYYLITHTLDDWTLFLPASAIGLLSTAVLNLNNMRDQVEDAKAGKNTLVVKLGYQRAKRYHYLLLATSFVLLVLFTLLKGNGLIDWLFIVAFIPLLMNVIVVVKNKEPNTLDSELKKVALATFFCALLIAISRI